MTAGADRVGYEPPPYPYDRLNELKPLAEAHDGGMVDFSIGTPRDPAPDAAVDAFVGSTSERGYPPSIGLPAARQAAVDWFDRRFDVAVPVESVAACIGTKEFVVSLPKFLALRRPGRDTVLYPEIAYPSYEMGATLAGQRAVPVPVDEQWRLRLDQVSDDDAQRALCLWVNTPGNPAGGLDDLEAAVAWARERGVLLFSDECYIEFTWQDPYGLTRPGGHAGRTVLEHGLDGVIAVHSLSKRSNFAGARFGFYAGDPELVHYLSELRKHSGMMVPGPVQHGAIAALGDDAHVDAQRDRYWARLARMAEVLRAYGLSVELPGGGFYLWVAAPDGDAWALARDLAKRGGVLVSPGEFYGPAGAGHVRVALVDNLDRIELVASRLGV